MIKKICALAIVCIVPLLHANTYYVDMHDVESPRAWLEIKPGYFFFSNHMLRKIYHHGGFEIQGSATYLLCEMIALYGSLGFLHAKGKSLQANQETSISQIPLDVGLRAIADFNERAKGYLSIGPRYFYFHQHNDSNYVSKNVRRNGIGFFLNGGCNFIKNDRFLLGVFGEYAFEQKSFKSTMLNVYGRPHVQVGGFTFGASIGFVF